MGTRHIIVATCTAWELHQCRMGTATCTARALENTFTKVCEKTNRTLTRTYTVLQLAFSVLQTYIVV